MAVQLAGCEPQVMAEAARLNEDRGAAIIDINMGCPVKKVVNGDAGSALMRDLPLAAANIEATVKAVSVPVTLKMRMGWDHASLNAPELARIAEPVSPDLEICAVTDRVSKSPGGGPALLFERDHYQVLGIEVVEVADQVGIVELADEPHQPLEPDR